MSFADLLDKTERFVNILESVQNIKYLLSIDKFDKSQITARGGLWENAEHESSKDKKKVSNYFQIYSLQILSFGKLLNMEHQNLILIILKFSHMNYDAYKLITIFRSMRNVFNHLLAVLCLVDLIVIVTNIVFSLKTLLGKQCPPLIASVGKMMEVVSLLLNCNVVFSIVPT